MRLKLEDTKIYATEYTLSPMSFTPHNTIHELEIKKGYIDIDTSWISQECAKAEREKVWEMAEHILRIPYTERLAYFGTSQVFDIVSMPVDQALDMYESWKKANSVEKLINSLKLQDVVAYNTGRGFDYHVLMITRAANLDGKRYDFDGITCDGRTVVLHIFIDDGDFIIEKIGRVVETSDILGEIKKIEDKWRKNNLCGS